MKLLSPQQNYKKILSAQQKGFTLMEVMVSVSIFAIIITIGIGSLLTIFKTLQKTRTDRQTLDSVSYMMDTLTRRIRTAKTITAVSNEITLNDQEGKDITFSIVPIEGDINFQKLIMIEDSVQYDLTPPDFKINQMTFEQFGEKNSQQGMVKISINGITENKRDNTDTPMFLQTIVSKRVLDYES